MWYSPKPRTLGSTTPKFEHITLVYFPYFMFWANCTYSYVCKFIFLTWCNINHFKNVWTHSVGGQLDPLPVVLSMVVVLLLLILSPVIQFLCYHSVFHSVLALSFSEHNPVWSSWSHSPHPLTLFVSFVVYFWQNMKRFGVAICSKNNMNPLVLFMGYLQHGWKCIIWSAQSTLSIN